MTVMRVLLADDHPLILAALRSMVERIEGVSVVAEARDGRSAVDLARMHRPELAIVDISMSGLDGIEATAQIRTSSPSTRVLVLSSHTSEDRVHRSFRAGASGYLTKGAGPEEIRIAIEAVMRGEFYFGSEIAGDLVARIRDPSHAAASNPLDCLSPRQRAVLELIAQGKRTKQVAHTLGVSVKTVETHRAEIMRRLGIDSVARLAILAARHGLVRGDP